MNGGGATYSGFNCWANKLEVLPLKRISKETLQICKRQIKKRTRNALPFMDLVPLMKFFLFKEIKT